MRKPIAGFWWSPAAEGVPALVVTAAFFTLGGLSGCVLAFRASEGGAEALHAYVESFLTLAQEGGINAPQLIQVFWRTLRWPVAMVFLGFSVLGLFGIPILSGLRGFFLGFSVAAFARAYGQSGLAVAFLLQGIPGMFAVPAFFLLSVQSFSSAWSLAGRGSGQGKRELAGRGDQLFRYGLCAAALGISLVLECCLVPILVTGWAGALLKV